MNRVNSEYIYLDYAAATPLDSAAKTAMQPYETEQFFNPSSPYAPALAVRAAYDAAKDDIARVIGAKSDELVMTAGATESINLAFQGVRGHVVTSAIEHPAVLEPARARDHTIVGVSAKGVVLLDELKDAIRADTQLVSIALANNEIGTIQRLRDIATIIAEERQRRKQRGDTTPIYLHSDASQGLGLIDIHVSRLGVDMLTLNAAKVYGPKQVGLLWASRGVTLQAATLGGGQERGLRSGTENVAGVIGFAAAIKKAEKKRVSENERLAKLRNTLKQEIISAIPDVVMSGDEKKQLPNFIHASFPFADAERVLFMLETKGVLVATGSACAANKGTRSHVLEAIGLAPEVADGSIRMTLGRDTTDEQVAIAARELVAAVRGEYQRGAST